MTDLYYVGVWIALTVVLLWLIWPWAMRDVCRTCDHYRDVIVDGELLCSKCDLD